MKRIIAIDYCDQCPHFDDAYYNYLETCMLLNQKIARGKDTGHIIPDACPLPVAEG